MKNSRIEVLAIGDRFSAAFTSLEHALMDLGDVTYLHEKTFVKAEDSVDYVRNSSFDVAVMPNPYGNEKRLWVYRHLKKAGFPVIVFDRGALPGSWFFDVGFNADSPTYRTSGWDNPLSNEQAATVKNYLSDFLAQSPLESQGEYVEPNALKEQLGIAGKRVLFVAFQRPSDTTIKYFAGRIQTYSAFCKLVEDVNAELRRIDSDWVVVAKKHPLEPARPNSRVQFVHDSAHINSLIEAADMVMVVNSGVGLIASIFDKPVLIAGDAFYAHNGLNRSVGSVHEVLYYLNKGFEYDAVVRDRLVFHLIERVYSFATFKTERVKQKDGSFRNITRHIEFQKILWPEIVKKKSCLFVSSVLPIPVNRGNAQRTDQFISAFLELGYRVKLLLLNQSEASARSIDIAKRTLAHYGSIFLSVEVRRHPMFENGEKKKANILRRTLAGTRRSLAELKSKLSGEFAKINSKVNFPNKFKRLVAAESTKGYDVTWVNYAKLYDKSCFFGKVVIDLHDVQINRIENDVLPKLPARHRKRYARIAASSEREVMSAADTCISISPLESIFIKQEFCPAAKVKTIKATDRENFISTFEYKFDLLFIGSNSDPNVDGLIWFLGNVWPLVIDNQDIKLRIQGNITRNPKVQSAVKNAVKFELISLGGFVPNLADIYRSSRIVICPIRYGTGMKIKVVEAMSYGMPIVATSAALEGISLEHGLAPVDDPVEISQQILQLANFPDSLASASSAARSTFLADHSYKHLVEALDELLAELC